MMSGAFFISIRPHRYRRLSKKTALKLAFLPMLQTERLISGRSVTGGCPGGGVSAITWVILLPRGPDESEPEQQARRAFRTRAGRFRRCAVANPCCRQVC